MLMAMGLLLCGVWFAKSYAQIAGVAESAFDQGMEKKIFLDLRDINVVDILKFLAVQGDLNIVTSKNVQGRSTLVLRNVKIRDAIDIIVISNQLAYERMHDILYIMTEDEYLQKYGRSYNDKRRIMSRALKYTKPAYVASVLEAIQSTLGKVVIDEDTGTVIAMDIPEKLEEMSALIGDMERKLDTAVVPLQYANAKELEIQLKNKLDVKAVGTVFADERSNQLVVSAYPGRMEEVLGVIRDLDRKTKAILLDVRILQLTLNPQYDSGIDWEKTFRRLERPEMLRSLDIAGNFPIDTNLGANVGKIAVGEIAADDFSLQIKALKQVQNTKVLANPRLMVVHNEEARINIGDRIPYVITTTTGTGNNTSVSEEIKFIDVGLSLVVTPRINDEGFITMSIRPEISSRTNTLVTPTNNQIPVVNTTFVESTVMVKDGMSVILGGLKRDDVSETSRGMPFVQDIPLLGNLFKNRNESVTRTEIVLFITPKITGGDTMMTDDPLPIKKGVLEPRDRGAAESLPVRNPFGKNEPVEAENSAVPIEAGAVDEVA